jgi:actin-related protein
MFKGFIERLEKELKTVNPSSIATQNLYKDQSSYLNLLLDPIFSHLINYVPSVHINPICCRYHLVLLTNCKLIVFRKSGSIISKVSTFMKIGISKEVIYPLFMFI